MSEQHEGTGVTFARVPSRNSTRSCFERALRRLLIETR